MVPYLNPTTMTAAGPKFKAVSWEGSKSLGRFCGSIYATTVAKSLIKLEGTSLDESPATYAGFCNTVHKHSVVTLIGRARGIRSNFPPSSAHGRQNGALDREFRFSLSRRDGKCSLVLNPRIIR